MGRRTAKIAGEKITRYLWDGNVLLQEWTYDLTDRPELKVSELGELYYDTQEPVENLITWVYEEGSFVPCAKIENGQTCSIISDYIGRPVQAFDEAGEVVWETDYDIYGRLRDLKGSKNFIPFRQLGQYEDPELDGLYYNRFRYYDSQTGLYVSQDPIGLEGNNPNFYAYVFDSNTEVDVLGLFFGKIIGSAQSTGTFGHAFASNLYARLYSLNPRVERVTMDLGYKRLLGGGDFKYGPRPDVGVLYKDGSVKIIEVASKTDKLDKLISRNQRFMNRNAIRSRGVKVSKLALILNKIKSKFNKPIKCK